jgi:hypothetical protein
MIENSSAGLLKRLGRQTTRVGCPEPDWSRVSFDSVENPAAICRISLQSSHYDPDLVVRVLALHFVSALFIEPSTQFRQRAYANATY